MRNSDSAFSGGDAEQYVRYATIFVSLLGPAQTYPTPLTQVLPSPPPFSRAQQAGQWVQVLFPNTRTSEEQEVDYIPALLLSASSTLLFPTEKQWRRCADWGGHGVERPVGRSYTRVVILCLWDCVASARVPGNLTD